jgi:hypothetical protein
MTVNCVSAFGMRRKDTVGKELEIAFILFVLVTEVECQVAHADDCSTTVTYQSVT